MQLRPATAARWASVAAIELVRCSGVLRRNGFPARSLARRRSGVRFIETPLPGACATPSSGAGCCSPCRRRSRRSLRNRQDDPRGRRAAAPLRCDRACPADLRAATATSSRRRRRRGAIARVVFQTATGPGCLSPVAHLRAVASARSFVGGRSEEVALPARGGIQAGRAAHRRRGPCPAA